MTTTTQSTIRYKTWADWLQKYAFYVSAVCWWF